MGQATDIVVQPNKVSMFSKGVKRMVDFTTSLIGLILLSPLFLCIYIRLKRQGDGDVFFKQERVGYKGAPFMIYKFRSMTCDAEKNGVPQLAEQADSRLTPVGKWLRETHLDELPQLWNVLIGDMSLVGPRPERQFFIDKIMAVNPNYELLYQIRPGITSEATLYNGYTDTLDKMIDRLNMDLHYLQNRSLKLDFMIVFKTVASIVGGKKI